jgi:hypothetical protein
VVVLFRHPAAIYSSWLALDLPDADRRLDRQASVRRRVIDPLHLPDPGTGRSARAIWQLGVLLCALEDAVARHPEWHVRSHEELCLDPDDGFRALATELDIPWSGDAAAVLRAQDRDGSGFSTERRTGELPDAWRTRLSAAQVDELRRILGDFPLRRWADDGFGRPA